MVARNRDAIMKVIIAGGRNLQLSILDIDALLESRDLKLCITEVVSGTAKGIDKCGESWADYRQIKIKRFPPKLKEYGSPAAYHQRNNAMAHYADILFLIWDGKSNGSKSMKKFMKKLNKPIYEVIV